MIASSASHEQAASAGQTVIETHTELRRLPVAEWVVELWERVLAKTSEMNVRIVAGGSEVVGARVWGRGGCWAAAAG